MYRAPADRRANLREYIYQESARVYSDYLGTYPKIGSLRVWHDLRIRLRNFEQPERQSVHIAITRRIFDE